MSLYPHYGLQKPVRRPVRGPQILIGYDRTWGQRVAWGLAKITLQAALATAVILLFIWLVFA